MSFYLFDHPNPNYPQTRPRSAWGSKFSGTVMVHTAEGALDAIAPDTGAENVAGYIASRSDAGGYHELVDSDSVVTMAPDDWMTWHTAAYSLNGPAWGISAACRTTDWNPDDSWTKKTIAIMGARIAAVWERNGFNPRKCARWLTQSDVQQSPPPPGLCHHGTAQPGDRTDAWARLPSGAPHPHKARLDQMLIDAIVGTPIEEEDDMTPQEWASWLTGIPANKVKPNDVTEKFAIGDLFWLSGQGDAERVKRGEAPTGHRSLADVIEELHWLLSGQGRAEAESRGESVKGTRLERRDLAHVAEASNQAR